MAATCLGQGGSATHFNSIPDFCCAKRAFDARGTHNLINSLKGVFLKHDVQDRYGLILNHRHFLLEEEEILVETLNENGKTSYTTPWNLRGNNAEPVLDKMWANSGLRTKNFVVPQTWAFTTDGELVPFEYIATDNPQDPIPTAKFVVDLFTTLQKHGVHDLLGLRRLDDDRDGEAFEMTEKGSRVSITRMGSEAKPEGIPDKEMVKVLWYFTKDGELKEGGACTRCGTCVICWN